MIKTIFKNLVTPSATRAYPIDIRPGFKNARGELANKIRECTLCSLCAKKCPSAAIRVDRKAKVWEVNPYACVYCGICAEACPQNCLIHYTEHRKPVRQKTNLVLQKDEPATLKVVSPA